MQDHSQAASALWNGFSPHSRCRKYFCICFCWLIVRGLLIKILTTQEPDDAQLEVALAALKGVLDSGQELR